MRFLLGRVLLLIAGALVGLLGVATASARADTYIYVDNGTAWQLNGANSPTFQKRPERDVQAAAFDGSGRLWLSSTYTGQDCVLTSPSFPHVSIVPSDLAYPGGTRFRNIHLCSLGAGPGDSLFVQGDNGTLGSSVVWQLNTSTLALRRITAGAEGSVSPSGIFAARRHTYFRWPRTGTWEALIAGPLSRPSRIKPVVRAPRQRSSDPQVWNSPAFARDGRLAVSRDGRVVVGGPGHWTAVGPRGRSASMNAWDSSGDLFTVTTYPCCTLTRIPGGAPGPTDDMIDGTNITSLAIGPDNAAPMELNGR